MFSPARSALFAACTALLAPAAASATEVKVENYSNGTIFVAQADGFGQVVSHGWTAIPPNGSHKFVAAGLFELYLRVQDANGKEITFPKHNEFGFFPTRADRFNVTAKADDPNVRVLKHGASLQFSQNVTKTEPLPAGWTSSRYFRVHNVERLEITP